jgi:hypothetical protein
MIDEDADSEPIWCRFSVDCSSPVAEGLFTLDTVVEYLVSR